MEPWSSDGREEAAAPSAETPPAPPPRKESKDGGRKEKEPSKEEEEAPKPSKQPSFDSLNESLWDSFSDLLTGEKQKKEPPRTLT